MYRIHIWQWPNLLALDAALIAVCWQATLSNSAFATAPATVLALSVWLTYMADRLFDVSKRDHTQLVSARHRFAKQHIQLLWRIWSAILIVDLAVALLFLSPHTLKQGLWLLGFCLLYTQLNQVFSKYFFPKEVCVALIFAAGTVILMQDAKPFLKVFALSLLCLCNCLAISRQEQYIDLALGVHSLSSVRCLLPISFIACGGAAITFAPIIIPSYLALLLLVKGHRHITAERFRVLADLSLLISPAIAYLT